MGSSAQNSSGVHLCRRRVRFNEGPGEGSRKPWCKAKAGSGEGQGGFGAEPGQVQQVSEKVPDKVWEAQVQQGSGEGVGDFGAEPGQVQQGYGEGSGEGLGGFGAKARSCSTGFPRRFRRRFREALVQSPVRFNRVPKKVPEKVWEALVESQVKFNRVPEKVPEKVPGGFGAEPHQVQQGSGEGSGEGQGGFGAEPGEVQQGLVQSQVRFNRGSGEGSGEGSRKPWCKAKSGLTGSGEGCREGPGEGFGNLWCRARSGSTGSTGFPALGFAARFRKMCQNKMLRLLGIPPKLILCAQNRVSGHLLKYVLQLYLLAPEPKPLKKNQRTGIWFLFLFHYWLQNPSKNYRQK